MIATDFTHPHLSNQNEDGGHMGSGLPAQQASRRLDEYGTRTLVVGALGVSVGALSSTSLTVGAP